MTAPAERLDKGAAGRYIIIRLGIVFRAKPGVVLVSTGILRFEEPSADRDCVSKRT